MVEIEKRQADRLRVMKAIFDASGGSELTVVSGQQLLEEVELPDQELADACEYLKGEQLITYQKTSWGYFTPFVINITHRGIREMEQSLRAPTEPTQHFPPAISVIHIEGNVTGSAIYSGSTAAQQEMAVGDINIQSTDDKKLPPESNRARIWRLILLVAVSGAGAAITGLLGVSQLNRLSLAIVIAAVGATLAAVTYAIAEKKNRTWALGISTGICAALLLWVGISGLTGPSPARTANVVANKEVYISTEAGVSPAKEPVYNQYGKEYIDPGTVVTATCYSTYKGSVWLFFRFSGGDNGWAPFNDFHYQNGFAEQLPSHC